MNTFNTIDIAINNKKIFFSFDPKQHKNEYKC